MTLPSLPMSTVEREWVRDLLSPGVTPTSKNCVTAGRSFSVGRGEVPMEEFLVGVVAGVGSAVAAEDFGRVVGGVEADAEKVGLFVEGGVGGEGLVDVGEVAAHARAEVGELAASVDEGEENDLAVELVEVDGAVALVEEVEVGDGVAGRGDVVGDRRFVVGTGLRDDDDVVELDVGVVGRRPCRRGPWQ